MVAHTLRSMLLEQHVPEAEHTRFAVRTAVRGKRVHLRIVSRYGILYYYLIGIA